MPRDLMSRNLLQPIPRPPTRTLTTRVRFVARVAALALLGCHAMALATTQKAPACHVGAYALASGEVLDISATGKPGVLRWHRMDGRTGTLESQADGVWRGQTGWTTRADPVAVTFGACGAGDIQWGDVSARRLVFDVTDTAFQSGDVSLRGRLVMPPGTATVPVVVLVHGSERYSGVDLYSEQHLLPANGIGVFVYDKRGTGGSSGAYTQDFSALAGDAVAALAEARRLGGARVSRIGLHGSSQGGWVAPLAATRAPVDYVVVAYGLAESPADEDAAQVMLDLTAAGHGAETLALARTVTEATGDVMSTRSPRAYAALGEVRRAHRRAPWWDDMQGEYTGQLTRYPVWLTRLVLPRFDQGTPWRHDPMPVLRSVKAPQLWMLAALDAEAPLTGTIERLATLAEQGRPMTVAVFPDTDHGLVEFETAADGTRTRTRHADGVLRMTIDFIRDGRLGPVPYGRAVVGSGPSPP